MFTITHLLPGDAARAAAGPNATQKQVEKIRKKLGLDKPLPLQYLDYIWGVLHGDLGTSILKEKPVSSLLITYLPASLELIFVAMFINVIFAFPLGIISALKSGQYVDMMSRLLAAVGMGMPVFWFGLIAQFIFFGQLHILPAQGRVPYLTTLPNITGSAILDSIFTGNLPLLGTVLLHLIMPATALALPEIAVISRLTRNSMLEVLEKNYITSARAKGLPEFKVTIKHAFKNAVLAPLTVMGMQIGWLLGNTILVESIFGWGGLGSLAVSSIYHKDFSVIVGITMVIAFIFVVANTLVDILYAYLDPRIIY